MFEESQIFVVSLNY